MFRFYSSRFIFLRHSLPFYSFYVLPFLVSGRVYLGCGVKCSPIISGDLVFHCLRFFSVVAEKIACFFLSGG